jgi:hypothetical protein
MFAVSSLCCRLRDILYLAKDVLHGADKISLEDALKRANDEKADLDAYVALTDDILYLIKHSPAEELKEVKVIGAGYIWLVNMAKNCDIVSIHQYYISGAGFN